jgi:Spy/CpxP family protein refolding chaperone
MNKISLTIVLAACVLPSCFAALGQQNPADFKAVAKEARKKETKGRLPAYYGQIVNPAQRQRIYQIQANYDPQIEALLAQIETLTEKRDAEIRAVLSPEQQQRLDTLIQGAKANRAAKAAQRKRANGKRQ